MSLVIKTLSGQVVDIIRNRILSGQVAPNIPIRQDTLAAELGISKIPLREALARLEQDGLIYSLPNRGYIVRPLTAEELEEIYALRLKLEPDAVAAGARRANAAERAAASEALSRFKEKAEASSVSGGPHNRDFHMALIKPCHNRLTAEFLGRLHVLADRYVCKHLEPLGRDSRADAEHDQMLDAWLAGDGERAAALTYQHIHSTLEDLREQIG